MKILVPDNLIPEPGEDVEPIDPETAALIARHIQRNSCINPATGRMPIPREVPRAYTRYSWDKGFDCICVRPGNFVED